ncbi:MAG TPA: hypothetical protein VMT32_15525, partial [Bryobacteraceae bacterium]|nr:hypothetical protein [Bryobacteraceae bacterium]
MTCPRNSPLLPFLLGLQALHFRQRLFQLFHSFARRAFPRRGLPAALLLFGFLLLQRFHVLS